MNAITPENEIPPAQSTAASGTCPTEQTNENTATSGPTTTFSASCAAPDECVTKRPLKKLIGRSATNPAITKPPVISFQSIPQSLRKLCATSDQAETDVNRSRHKTPAEPAVWRWSHVSAACA